MPLIKFVGLSVATLCILIRTSFRVAELGQGLHSKLADDEVLFMILEGAMIAIAGICLAAGHPGVAFSGRWCEADFKMRSKDNNHAFQRTKSNSVQLTTV